MAVSRFARAAAGCRNAPRWGLWLFSGSTAAVVLFMVIFGTAVIGMVGRGAMGGQTAACGTSPSPAVVQVTGTLPTLTAEQQHNAQVIAGVALARGLGEQAVLVGITTALAESSLINVAHGDAMGPSSIGLFQQMPSWGPTAVRTDPAGAAGLFYDALLKVSPAWTTLSIPAAAQAVEHSEFDGTTFWPGRGILRLGQNYADQLNQAQGITNTLMAGQPAAGGPAVAVPVAGPTSVTIGPLAPATAAACPGAAATAGAVYSPPGLQQNNSQDPSTFGWTVNGPQEPLVWQGHNFGQVAKGTAKLWTAMLTELVPLIPGGLNSNIGCLDVRRNVNNPSVWSFHAFGLACDLNSDVNSNGAPAQSLQGKQYALPMATHDIVAKYCFQWGGDFKGTPDPMHIETHCTPSQIAAWAATQP
jgi:hypothetical protein